MNLFNIKLSFFIAIILFFFFPCFVRAQEKLYYLHQDHLGSTNLATDSQGQIISRQSYYAYGSTRNKQSLMPTEKQYTSQISDVSQTGLYYYNARYYNSNLALFTQADTAGDGLNKYFYVKNNPLKYIDLTGNSAVPVRYLEAEEKVEEKLHPNPNSIGVLSSREKTEEFQNSKLYNDFFKNDFNPQALNEIIPIWMSSSIGLNKNEVLSGYDRQREYLSKSAIKRFLSPLDDNELFGGYGISGEDFIFIGKKYNLNPVFMLALAIEESGAGISSLGRKKANVVSVGGIGGTSDWEGDVLANLMGGAYVLREYLNAGMSIEEALTRYKSAGDQQSYDRFLDKLMNIYRILLQRYNSKLKESAETANKKNIDMEIF